ncbi:MAG: hypothetical protein AAF593_07580 [Planctomycetota bacterium]
MNSSWVGIVIAILVVFGPIIANVLREVGKGKGPRRDDRSRDSGDGRTSRERLDDLAARRRAELSAEGQRRRAESGGAGASSGGDPGNMTMAERIARARAAQQQQRGQARAGTPLPSERPATRQPPRSATPAPTGASARQQRAQALRQKMQQRQQQQRDALAARQRQIQQARAQRSAPAGGPQAAPTRRPLPPVQTPHPAKVEPHREVHRMVEDVAVQEVGSSRRKKELAAKNAKPQLIDFARLSRKDLQRAFVLKEVLDRPVAERDPLADSSL